MDNGELDELQGFGIKKRSEDKLTYKNIIARSINYCLAMRGSKFFHIGVENLVSTVEFNVQGYNFIDELEKIHDELMEEKNQKIQDWKKEYGRKFYRKDIQAVMKLDLYQWGWEAYFQKVIQLLASHNLLFETEKYVPIRIKERMADDVYEEQ